MVGESCKIWSISFAAIVAVLASTIFYSQFSLNHDASWYLVSTRMFMDGATLYDDIVEINPPLAFYLTVPALLLSDLTALPPTTAFFLYTSILGGLSVLWVHFLVQRMRIEVFAKWLIVLAAFLACFAVAVHDYGQREHLLLIFAMPYFVYLIMRDDLDDLSCVELTCLGVAAFFGLGLKPYFLLLPGGIIVTRFLRTRDWREFVNSANVALGLTTVGYLGFITLVHPLYLEQIVPTASVVYSAYGRHPLIVFVRPETIALTATLAIAALCRRELDIAAWAMLGGLTGAVVSYLVQFKGWNYQIIPVSFFILLTSAWITCRTIAQSRRKVLLGALSIVAISMSLGNQLSKGPYRSLTTETFGRFVHNPGVPVLVLSSNVSASFPFVNEVDARWTSRYPTQWLLPGAIFMLDRTDCSKQPQLCVRLREILLEARSAIIEDFARNRPALVYVDDRQKKPYFGRVRFDYVPFLLEDPEFAAMWQEFSRIDHVSGYEVWGRTTAHN